MEQAAEAAVRTALILGGVAGAMCALALYLVSSQAVMDMAEEAVRGE